MSGKTGSSTYEGMDGDQGWPVREGEGHDCDLVYTFILPNCKTLRGEQVRFLLFVSSRSSYPFARPLLSLVLSSGSSYSLARPLLSLVLYPLARPILSLA